MFLDFFNDFKHNLKLLHISWTAVGGCMLASSCWQSKVKPLFLNLSKRDLNYLTFAVAKSQHTAYYTSAADREFIMLLQIDHVTDPFCKVLQW